MKTKYELLSNDEHVDVPSGWYGDVTRYQTCVDKALKAMKENEVDYIGIYWVGEVVDEGFIEPSDNPESCDVKIEGDEDCAAWKLKDGYDYEDRWEGPHFEIHMENSAILYWNAKYHDAKIKIEFPVQGTMEKRPAATENSVSTHVT